MKKDIPEWVLKHKKKGIDIRFINNNYYAYKRHSVWDSVKKRAKTITDEYLGRITEEGIIKSKHQRIMQELSKANIKPDGSLGTIEKSSLEELEKALAKIEIPPKVFIKEPIFEDLKRVFGKDVEVLVNY